MRTDFKCAIACLSTTLFLTACKDPDVVVFSPEGEENLRIGMVYEMKIDHNNDKLLYAVATDENSGPPGYSQFLVKYSADNKLMWKISDDGFGNFAQFLFSDSSADQNIAIDNHNNVLFSHYSSTTSEVITQLVSPQGDLLWEHIEPGYYANHNSVAITDSGTYLRKNSYGEDFTIWAYSEDGSLLWERTQQFSDEHIYEVTEMSVEGNLIHIKDPLNITVLNDNGELVQQISTAEMGVTELMDMDLAAGRIAAFALADDEFQVVLMDSELNIIARHGIEPEESGYGDGIVTLGEDGVACYLLDSGGSRQTPVEVGAISETERLWSQTPDGNQELTSEFVSLDRVNGHCSIALNKVEYGPDVPPSEYRLLAFDDLGGYALVHSEKNFRALSSTASDRHVHSTGSYDDGQPYTAAVGAAAYLKGKLIE